jgi:hypothetical protein
MPDDAKRHFPHPWVVDDNGGCFIVRDANSFALGYFYYEPEEEPGRRTAVSLMKQDEARRIAADFAKLPELITLNE